MENIFKRKIKAPSCAMEEEEEEAKNMFSFLTLKIHPKFYEDLNL